MRRCLKARKRIAALLDSGLRSLDNIQGLVQQYAAFVHVRGISMPSFCTVVRRCEQIERNLKAVDGKQKNLNRLYKLLSVSESVTALDAVCNALSKMEVDINHGIAMAQMNVKNSTVVEALVPLLQMEDKIMPNNDGAGEEKTAGKRSSCAWYRSTGISDEPPEYGNGKH